MNRLFSVLTLITFFAANSIAQAPKFGYVNTQELLAAMPEVKQADSELETYQAQLISKGQDMVKEFETDYQKFASDVQQGLLSQVQIKKKEEELGTKQQDIQKYEVDVQTKIMKKRESLYQPILDRVRGTIETYGKDNGYTMIFDTSNGTLLHALENDNLIEEILELLQ
jgi:outer membrane protein